MNRSLNRVLLAGVSPLAILVVTAGAAWAGAGDGLSFDTDSVNGGTLTNANTGTSYSSGTLTVNGSQAGTGLNDGLHFGGGGSSVPALIVNIGAVVSGGTSTAGPNSPTGITVVTTGGTLDFNIAQSGSVTASVGNAIAINSSSVNSLTNRGIITGANVSNSNAIGIGGGGLLGTLTNYGTITSGSDSSMISVNGGTLGTLLNKTGGVISNTGSGSAIEIGNIDNAASTGGTTIINDGRIFSSGTGGGVNAISMYSAGNSITNNGSISGGINVGCPTSMAGCSALDSSASVTIISNVGATIGTSNSNLTIGNYGVGMTLTNYGTISKSTAGTNDTAISNDSATSGSTITNYGIITGRIKASSFGDTIIFDGSQGGATMTGNITDTGSGTSSTVKFQGGTTTFTGNISSNSVTIASGSTLVLGSDSTIASGGIIDNGTLDLGTYKLTQTNDPSLGVNLDSSGDIIKTTINANAHTHGYIVLTHANASSWTSSDLSSVTVVPVIIGSVTSGSKYVLLVSQANTVLVPTSITASHGVNWTASAVAGTGQTDTDGVSYGTGTTDIILTAGGSTTAATTTMANSKGLTALANYSGSNAAMLSLSNAVNNLTSTADIEKAAAQLRPSVNGSTTQAALGAVGQAINTISIRTDSVRAASAETGGRDGTGVSSGEMLRGLGIWTQGFGSSANQDKRLGVDGYSADTYGLAFGADTKVMEPVRVGLSFAYARTNVDDSGDRAGSGQKINSYIGSLYGTYTANRWYMDGALTYGHHDYAGTRVIAITGAATQVAKSSYAGEQYGTKAEVGVPFAGGRATLTPLVSLAYNHLNQDGYTETGAAAALTVGASSTDSLKSGLGAKVSATIAQLGDWNVKPNARAMWNHEFNTSSQNQTSTYVAGGASFTDASAQTAAESFDLGIGFDMASVRNMVVSAKYDAGLSDRYVSHTGSLQFRAEF